MNTLKLRPLQQADFPYVLAWSKDTEFCAASSWEIEREEGELVAWWERCIHLNNPTFVRLGIEYQEKLIGYADLAEIHHHQAEIGITIGERKLWGRGLGTKVVQQLMQYGVEKLHITLFLGETHATNIGSQKMLEKLGFKEISRNGSELYCNEKVALIQYEYHV
ncbi:GNAT family N-acetyltransferase [Metasolibacillus meyeri]|uniref:GNAT family N-acetyltransferase n=1 Tax=Metasolibacillus meyeri TaxID=1071052 RepID=A0AAW9NGG2_9BACL|nr:GNAT family N-acetyltransferase [Metasolibacillus meyeri]MEC1177679.1 GNAT family N-acetyltransferase [Metasolibacillus meyeri]